MIALPNYQPLRSVLPLVRTLLDITLLRKGPDAIPVSGMLLLMAIGLWLLSSLSVLSLIDQYEAYRRMLEAQEAAAEAAAQDTDTGGSVDQGETQAH